MFPARVPPKRDSARVRCRSERVEPVVEHLQHVRAPSRCRRSVSTSFSVGWRSNTPAKMSVHSARCEYNPASINEHRQRGVVGHRSRARRSPLWWLIGMSSSSHSRPDRLVLGRDHGGSAASGGTPGSRMPPNSPARAPSGSRRRRRRRRCRKICAMPARRPGASSQKSASQRLCALQPGPAQLVLAAAGAPRCSLPEGRTAGSVFGNSTSATTPSCLSLVEPALASPSCGTRSALRRSSNGFWKFCAHSSNSLVVLAWRYSR